ncbi:SGNH/GDSL hydrolase family protein, partial [Acinetobacter baumannii]|nr:SGNH/GDSL hydrolase family protein [Acinetobacter baumannii]
PSTDPNVVGLMNEAYANIMKDIGKLYGVPVLDLYNLTGLNEKNKFYYLGDDPSEFTAYLLHPKIYFSE